MAKQPEDTAVTHQMNRPHRSGDPADALESQKRQRRVAREKLEDMVSESEMFGDYDVDPEELSEILAEVRGKK